MTDLDMPAAQYVDRFGRRLRTMLLGRCPQQDLDDVVQSECLRVCEQFESLRDRFPSPEAYAAQRAKSRRALIDFTRRQHAQAGRGAVSVFDDQGRRVRGRDVVCGDNRPGPDHKGGTYFEIAAAREADRFASSTDHLDDLPLLRAALIGLSDDERSVLYLVDGLGFTVTQVAKEWGLARETVARKRSAARRKLHINPPC